MDDTRKEMLQKMHDSYLQRDEHRLKNVIALITGTLIVFSAYAVLFVQEETPALKATVTLCYNMESVSLYAIALWGMTFVADLLLSLFFFVSLNFGYTSTKEHVKLHIVQQCFGINGKTFVANKLYSVEETKSYGPFGFIPDFYIGLCVYSMSFQLIFPIATALRLGYWFPLTVVLLFFLVQCGLYVCVYRKYKRHLGR